MKRFFLLAIIITSALFIKSHFFGNERVLGVATQPKEIIVNDDGLELKTETNALTVSDLLSEQKIILSKNDLLYPNANDKLLPGMKIEIKRAKKVSLLADKKEKNLFGFGATVLDLLKENNIPLKEEDIVKPSRKTVVYNNMDIEIIRVEIKEETVQKEIAFKTITEKDDKMGWREKKTKQKGVPGIKEIVYEVAYHNGKEVSRKIIDTKIIKEPVPKIIVQGTYIKFGKTHKGVASWYAYTGTMSAANPWLPMGSYVKVTNLDNGKSVIVKINDRGPFGNGRIIDLDKVAFAKIAPLGQGTARIKMEEILN